MQPHELADALVRPRSSRRRSTTFDTRVTWRDQEVALRFVGPETAQKRALLVHGWEADSSDLDVIATHLAQLGMRCVLPDLPAHGASEGDTLMIPEAAELIRQIDAAYGRFSVVIGHSIGSAVVLLAHREGLTSQMLVMLTPPENYARQLSLSARLAGAPKPLIAAALELLRQRCPNLDEVDSLEMASTIEAPMLIVSAGADKMVDPENGRRLAASAPTARWLEIPEATHRSVLNDPVVVQAIMSEASKI